MRLHAYLYRCAGFGVTTRELHRSVRQGYEASVRELVRYTPQAPEPPTVTPFPPGLVLTLAQVGVLITWWLNQMLTTPSPLQEKMTLFWHGHFTTAVIPVVFPAFLAEQNAFLRAHATGRFSDLLLGISRDRAMRHYLPGDENFARELLELFTLGRGHYTEADVKAAAVRDDRPRRFLGHTGQLSAEQILTILADHPQTARRLCGRLFGFFTGTPAPTREIDRLAAVYQQHRGSIAAVLEALFLGDAFRATAERRQAYKSPVEFAVSAQKVVSRPFRWQQVPKLREMGQVPWLPPSVAGWEEGAAWINTGTLLSRLHYAAELAGDERPPSVEHLLAAAGLPDISPSTRQHLERSPRPLEMLLASPDFQLR